MSEGTAKWLKEPLMTPILDAKSKTRAVHVLLRKGEPAVNGVQPNPNHLVFFNLGADQLPVSIVMLEQVQGVAISRIVDILQNGPDGQPSGVSRESRHHFFSLAEILGVLEKIEEANKSLPTPAPELACR